MRYVLVALAAIGIVVSSLALQEHYRTGASPCAINATWDCGTVNKSPFAEFFDVPVAVIGIGGYLLMGVLAFWRLNALLAWAAGFGLGFSLYLTHIEAHILEVWCLYCVGSLVIICLINILMAATAIANRLRANQALSSVASPTAREQASARH